MKIKIQRCSRPAFWRVSPFRWLGVGLILFGGWAAQCQSYSAPSLAGRQPVQSVSGQFIITSSGSSSTFDLPMARNGDEASAIRLEPALLSVMVERIKESIWHLVGVPAGAQWQGNITLALHAARRRDESTPISATAGLRGWNYRVDLPDILPRSQFVRAITSAVLFELAEHNSARSSRVPELPAWLVDGIAQQVMAGEVRDLLVASPGQLMNGLPQSRQESTQHGLDAVAVARQVLKQSGPLTFDQMSWPSDDQLAGNDGGAYRASTQVFLQELLSLPDGPARLNLFITQLPQYANWQTAFQYVYQTYFPRSLDVEKWWTLRTLNFLSRDPSPAWTPEVSRSKLDEILLIPVEVRSSSNSLPAHAQLTFQQAILRVGYNQQEAVFNEKIRELGMAELRLIPNLAGFAYGYRQVLADYLGLEGDVPVHPAGRAIRPRAGVRETLSKLNNLDGRRRVFEARIKPDVWNSGLN